MGRMRVTVAVVIVMCIFCLLGISLAEDKTPEQLVKDAKEVIKEVSIEDVKKMIDGKEKVILLDIRDKEEYLAGHIPGAVNMSRGLLDFHIHEIIPDKQARVVLY